MVRLQALAILLLVGGLAFPADDSSELIPDAINRSARCSECHEEIYAMWSRSLHSASLTDPIFESSYLRAYQESDGRARMVCLRCHAPEAVINGDLSLREPISREGITCDYCHSIEAIDLERREQAFSVKIDGVKRGPLADSESPVHEVSRSPLHESSEFCAGCHEYRNARDVPILSTYSEWKTSPQAKEGITCQNCRMPLGPGQVVRSGLGSDREVINLHNISGGHSSEQVRKAASL